MLYSGKFLHLSCICNRIREPLNMRQPSATALTYDCLL